MNAETSFGAKHVVAAVMGAMEAADGLGLGVGCFRDWVLDLNME